MITTGAAILSLCVFCVLGFANSPTDDKVKGGVDRSSTVIAKEPEVRTIGGEWSCLEKAEDSQVSSQPKAGEMARSQVYFLLFILSVSLCSLVAILSLSPSLYRLGGCDDCRYEAGFVSGTTPPPSPAVTAKVITAMGFAPNNPSTSFGSGQSGLTLSAVLLQGLQGTNAWECSPKCPPQTRTAQLVLTARSPEFL
ncbi:unnamed protein product, partial [Timema podura]|nr:unnamed protein product [Timema podura]